MYKFISLELDKKGKVVETLIAEWRQTKNYAYATNFAEGYIQAFIDLKKTTIYYPSWKGTDGYMWWNRHHTKYWVVVDGNNHIVAPNRKKGKYNYKNLIKQMESKE